MTTSQRGSEASQPAASTPISLSQAILAPLDAVMQAQIHAARSFLNVVLQVGFAHQPLDQKHGQPGTGATEGAVAGGQSADKDELFNMTFGVESMVDGQKRKSVISIPALSLIPIRPLAVDSANFSFDFRVNSVERFQQLQASRKDSQGGERQGADGEAQSGYDEFNRPWFLVSKPMSINGMIAPKNANDTRDLAANAEVQSAIHVEIKVVSTPMPAALDRLLTTLSQSGHIVPGESPKK